MKSMEVDEELNSDKPDLGFQRNCDQSKGISSCTPT